ncbi:MAG: DUF4159 domain-containing protein [Phycisphaerae bacterium]|nr:DUF4159 domain-containing protein [Gemmatimonadaceae bacterium]
MKKLVNRLAARFNAHFANASRSRKVWTAVAVAALAAAPIVWAQGGRNRQATYYEENVPYDGRYTFVRIKYDMTSSASFGRRQDIKWAHDYPRGERHFTKIVNELSSVRAREMGSNILTLDSPELGKYPIAHLCEAGFWLPSEAEVLGLRNYLAKGGLIIFDDFFNDAWYNFETQIKRVLPNVTFIPLTEKDVLFDTFYRIPKLDAPSMPNADRGAQYLGIFEDNDRSKRLLAIINYNNDLSEFWEFSDEGVMPIDITNEAYKIGINYIIYALTR